MKIIKHPQQKDWKQILQRPVFDSSSLQQKVKVVMNEVKAKGDTAVKLFTQEFDGVAMESFMVSTTSEAITCFS